MKRDVVHTTLERLARRLDAERIPYAIVGGMALSIHGYTRVTEDVDVLMTASSLAKFEERCLGRGYIRAFAGAQKSFRDAQSNVTVDVITTGEYPGDGKPKRIAFPDPEGVAVELEGLRVIPLEKLVELKLASGLSAGDRLRDLADVQDLIVRRNLPLELAQDLDESVRGEYERLWESTRGARDS